MRCRDDRQRFVRIYRSYLGSTFLPWERIALPDSVPFVARPPVRNGNSDLHCRPVYEHHRRNVHLWAPVLPERHRPQTRPLRPRTERRTHADAASSSPRGAELMSRDFSIDDEREPNSSLADNSTLGRSGSDQADSSHTRSTRSQRPSADSRTPRSRDEVPERSYEVSQSQAKTIADVGTFRTIALSDLTHVRYGGNEKQALAEVNNLLRQKLLRRSISHPDRAVYLALTPEGHRFLLARNGQGAHENQVFYHGFVKTRETEHDAAIYQLYQKEAENIIASGGKVTRVILDFELKKSVNRKLARLSPLPEEEQAQRKCEVANEHGLTVVKGRIQIPDLRLEYEDRDHNPAKVDLELATGHYRHASMAAKSSAGFKIYASASDAARLRPAMADPEIMQEI